MAPKTIKSFLKLCIDISNTDKSKLKGIDDLSAEEWIALASIRADIQNNLGELENLLNKYNLKYNLNY